MAYDVDSKKKLSTKFTQSDKKSHLIIIQSSVKKKLGMIKKYFLSREKKILRNL